MSRNWTIQHRCETCEVGGIEGPCWMCGQPMVVGETWTLLRFGRDEAMFQAITSFAPKEPLELKVLDDLVPLTGEDLWRP